jgi:serine/threonine-protein kinase
MTGTSVLSVGQIVADRYRLMEVVGKGGYSLVFRAIDRRTDAELAVKVLHDGLPHQEEIEARLEREFETLRVLEGTAAPRAHELLREGSSMCLVMELYRGQDLDEYLRDVEDQGERMDVGTLLEFMGPIVHTLEVAHDRGIIHRDLSPGNVFVLGRGGPGGVKLLDFGLAWHGGAKPITRDGMVIGSPSYIAPEVWAGNPRGLDHRIDVYSLAAVVFRALAGRVPFPGSSLREKLEAATRAPRPSLHALRGDLQPGVDAWVRRALAIDREERFPTIRGMWEALLLTLGEGSTRRSR